MGRRCGPAVQTCALRGTEPPMGSAPRKRQGDLALAHMQAYSPADERVQDTGEKPEVAPLAALAFSAVPPGISARVAASSE